jgi:hypothetical protein
MTRNRPHHRQHNDNDDADYERVSQPTEHGMTAGYLRHLWQGTDPCTLCRLAWARFIASPPPAPTTRYRKGSPGTKVKERRARVAELHARGNGTHAIAARLGYNDSTIRADLRALAEEHITQRKEVTERDYAEVTQRERKG